MKKISLEKIKIAPVSLSKIMLRAMAITESSVVYINGNNALINGNQIVIGA